MRVERQFHPRQADVQEADILVLDLSACDSAPSA